MEALRREAGLTQTRLAELADVSQQAISDIESSKYRQGNPVTMRRLADALTDALGREVAVSDLLATDTEEVA